MWHMDGGMGWWMLIGSVWFVFFWAVVIWAIVRVTERLGRHEGAWRVRPLRFFACGMQGERLIRNSSTRCAETWALNVAGP